MTNCLPDSNNLQKYKDSVQLFRATRYLYYIQWYYSCFASEGID